MVLVKAGQSGSHSPRQAEGAFAAIIAESRQLISLSRVSEFASYLGSLLKPVEGGARFPNA